ncbi:hypothetical protein [Catellatospora sp. NPDC049609]|uniref:hypothetical protein n=1 Tax=Catellatospora sp. NPDC049609 TaxID=3155505 RepID=UPI00342D3989
MAVRPGVGDPLRPCPACPSWEYGGAPACPHCAALVDALLEEGWRDHVTAAFGELSPAEEHEIALMVADEPHRHDWRAYDAALNRLTCAACGSPLGSGPLSCAPCELAHGNRYAAIETDRPGTPPGNEHAIRVNVSVVRKPHMTSAPELLARRLLLPLLLIGHLPTTAEAQRFSAALKATPTLATAPTLASSILRELWVRHG